MACCSDRRGASPAPVALAAALLATVVAPAGAFDMRDVQEMWQRDTGRVDPTELFERHAARVAAISGLVAPDGVEVVHATRAAIAASIAGSYKVGVSPSEEDERRGLEFLLREHGIDYDPESGPVIGASTLDDVGGLYEPRDRTVFIVHGMRGAALETVLLHETVHAGQDGVVDLDAFYGAAGLSFDAWAARAAVVEGQAVLVAALASLAATVGEESALAALSERAAAAGDAWQANASVPFADAIVGFPYLHGYRLALRSQERAGRESFRALLADPPASTEMVLHPERDARAGAPLEVPLARRFAGTAQAEGLTVLYATTAGEFFLRELLARTATALPSAEAAAGWGGDLVAVLRGPQGLFLLWDTLWDTPQDAAEFETAYRDGLRARLGADYPHAVGDAPAAGLRAVVRRSGARVVIASGALPETAVLVRLLVD